jgi:hypothetical protein
MPRPSPDRPVVFCSLIAAVFVVLIGIDRVSPPLLPKDSYFYHPWEYMMGSFRYNIPRTNERMELTGYGDLANMLGVPAYRNLRNFVWTNDHFGKRNADSTQHDAPKIVVVGDSFMASAADSDESSFVTQLQMHTDASVYGYVPSDMSVFLRDPRFQEMPPKTVLWGRVERNTLGSNGEIETILNDTSCFMEVSTWDRWEKVSKDAVKSAIGGFVEYAQLSILRRTMQQSLRNMIYVWTGQHTKNVLLVPGETMLFHDRGAAVLASPGEHREFDIVANAIAHVRDCLEARGTRLIFMAIPDKEHIYAEWLGREAPTPDPLLVLEQELDERNLDFVSLVKRFQEEGAPGKDILYWSDDTHWNARGIEVGVEEVVKLLK